MVEGIDFFAASIPRRDETIGGEHGMHERRGVAAMPLRHVRARSARVALAGTAG